MTNKQEPLRSLCDSDYAAIGQFIVACNHLETVLTATLLEWTGIKDEELAKQLVRAPQFSNLSKQLQGVFDVRARHSENAKKLGPSIAKLLKCVSFINAFRNVIAHKPCFARDGKISFSNIIIAKRNDTVTTELTQHEILSLAKLAAMATETVLVLQYRVDDDGSRFAKHLTELLSFRDKCVPPRAPGNESQKTFPKETHQRPSFPP